MVFSIKGQSSDTSYQILGIRQQKKASFYLNIHMKYQYDIRIAVKIRFISKL